jgi:hydrogenase-4 component F
MIGIYLAGSIILALLLFFVRKKALSGVFLMAFLILQFALTFHAYQNQQIVEWIYFMPDSIGILLLLLLSLISIPTFYHSRVYFNKHP